jgi:hypothetical protein
MGFFSTVVRGITLTKQRKNQTTIKKKKKKKKKKNNATVGFDGGEVVGMS